MKRKYILIGILLTLAVLAAHLIVLDDYGLTWDFHHHFFAGLHLLKHPITPDLTDHLPFTEPDPRGTYKLPFGPLMSIAPVATYVLFFEKLKLLAFDNAYNLSIVISGVAGVLFLFLFLLESVGPFAAFAGFIFLSSFPRYFGDLHNNMKDIPQAAAFMLAIWLFWRLVNFRRIRDLFWAVAAFAIAFNTKVNTLAVPIIAFTWTACLVLGKSRVSLKIPLEKLQWHNSKWILLYFILAPLAAIALWSVFWDEPMKQLLYIPQFFTDNTQHIEVLYFGKWFCSAVNVPWHYPLGYLAATTPLPMLICVLLGFATTIKRFRKDPIAPLLLLWFFIPIARYVYPKMGVIDGIRHFEEVVFPLAAIAAYGAATAWRWWMRRAWSTKKHRITIAVLISLVTTTYLVSTVVLYHPYQTAYFNELVGGINGAFTKFDLDYWGTSQKQAMTWLNRNAPYGSKVYVVMAADVAGKYLRPDLRENLNTTGWDGARFVVVLNRQSFFYRYFYVVEYMLRRKTTYIVQNQGAPLVWIFDNNLGQFPRGKEWWHGDSPCIRKYWNAPTP